MKISFYHLVIATLLLLTTLSSTAQQGYIYVHQKSFDESLNQSMNYSVAGGSTAVSPFALNDNATQIPMKDIGASQNGRLWAVGIDSLVYLREPNSSQWNVVAGINKVTRIDGSANDGAVVITNNGTNYEVYTITGTLKVVTLVGTTGTNRGGPFRDVASKWDNDKVYVIDSDGDIWSLNTTTSTWIEHKAGVNLFSRIDGDPTNATTILGCRTGSTQIGRVDVSGLVSTTNAAVASIGAYGTSLPYDVAATSSGQVYAFYNAGPTTVCKWNGVSSFTPELQSTTATSSGSSALGLTGGPNNQVWASGIMSLVAPYGNIISRAVDGAGTVAWLDDQRIRTTISNSNSVLIPVDAGTYTITGAIPSGWDVIGIDVYDPTNNSTTSVSSVTATINVAAGEVVNVVFKNQFINAVTVGTNCGTLLIQNFGSGTATYGPPQVGATPYHYNNVTAFPNDGSYALRKQFSLSANAPSGNTTIVDHSGLTNGYFLFINAAYTADDFYRQRVRNLIPGARYKLSFWAADVSHQAAIRPNVLAGIADTVSGAVISSIASGNITNSNWVEFSSAFTATTSTVDFFIKNNQVGGSGNDIAIDDIAFNIIPIDTNSIAATTNNSCVASSGSLTVTSPLDGTPAGADYEYSVDGVTYQDAVLFTGLNPGNYPVSVRAKGTTCASTKSTQVKISLCGNVFNDVNGLNGGGFIDGTGTNIGSIKVVIYDNTNGSVVAVLPVNSDGSYSGTLAFNNNYSAYLTTAPATIGDLTPPAITLPSGWITVGENIGAPTVTGNDNTPNSILALGTLANNVLNVNFAIERLPESAINSQVIGLNPGGIVNTTVNANWFATSNVGTNPNTQDYDGGTVENIRISAFPSNATSITINGVQYTTETWPVAGITIPAPGGVPSQVISVDPIEGTVSVVIPFIAIDNAGKEDATQGSVTLVYTSILAVKFLSFDLQKNNTKSILKFSIAQPSVGSIFEIERSSNGINFTKIGSVSAGNNTTFSFVDNTPKNGKNYYRVKEIDLSGKLTYTYVKWVEFSTDKHVEIFPMPASDYINMNVGDVTKYKNPKIQLYASNGQLVIVKNIQNDNTTINVSLLSSGIYELKLFDDNTVITTKKILIKK